MVNSNRRIPSWGGVRGVADDGCRIAQGWESVCCHLASMFVRLCVHMCCSTEYPFVVAVPAAVVPVGVDVFAVVVRSRQVLF